MLPKLLYQGAEAKIFLDEKENLIIKDRIKKSYRISELDDKIRAQRTRSETKLLEKASKIINAPKPFISGSTNIKMPYIKGKRLSENLDLFSLEEQKQIMKVVGEETAKLHDNDIIHGDLTTSNMILVEKGNDNVKNNDVNDNNGVIVDKRASKRGDKNSQIIFFIDFGLGFISKKPEDKAVDIHLLKQALEAKHFKNWQVLFEEFLKGYKPVNREKVLERLEAVEKRGRYRH